MTSYDRERVVRLFDEQAAGPRAPSNRPELAGEPGTVRGLVRALAFEQLCLQPEDVLLDVGCGVGQVALGAARQCRTVVGIDVSRAALERAAAAAGEAGLTNVSFAYGPFEDPCAELDLRQFRITKVVAVYALHHLTDALKRSSLAKLVSLLHRPGRLVIGDLMFFEDPAQHRDKFDEVYFDDGDTDFPSTADFLIGVLRGLGAHACADRVHPLAGVVVGSFE